MHACGSSTGSSSSSNAPSPCLPLFLLAAEEVLRADLPALITAEEVKTLEVGRCLRCLVAMGRAVDACGVFVAAFDDCLWLLCCPSRLHSTTSHHQKQQHHLHSRHCVSIGEGGCVWKVARPPPALCCHPTAHCAACPDATCLYVCSVWPGCWRLNPGPASFQQRPARCVSRQLG